MKKNKIFLLLSILITSCTTVNTVNPSPSSSVVSSAGLTTNPTTMSTPSVFPTAISSPAITATPESTPTPVSSVSPYTLSRSGLVKLYSSYISSPDTAFLVGNTFEFKILFTFNQLPEKEQLTTVFDLFDNGSNDKKSHFSLTLDSNKNFILKAENTKELINNQINFPSLEINKGYELIFSRTTEKIELTINGEKINSTDFKDPDFTDTEGKRMLNIGSNALAQNRLSGTIDYVDVKNMLHYDFNNSLADTYKYRLDALINSGSFEYITEVAASTPVPVLPTATPTPSNVSSTSVPERNVTDTSGTVTVDLGVYNSKDNKQYTDCLARREAGRKDNPNFNLDCLNETGAYTTPGFDLGSATFLTNQLGDLRFITNIIRDANAANNSNILIAGSEPSPRVNVIDLGLKSFEGLTPIDLENKVDYDKPNKVFSQSSFSTNLIVDHVYAIKTNRYGAQPKYAKILINDIITDDYQFIRIKAPEVTLVPQYVPYSGQSQFLPSKSYSYYVASFDGIGETDVNLAGNLAQFNDAITSQIKLAIKVPYGAKGYSIYRVDNTTSQIYKIGPILSAIDVPVEIFDRGDRGFLVDSLPSSNNTVKNGFKPASDSKPIKVNFTYRFDGDSDKKF